MGTARQDQRATEDKLIAAFSAAEDSLVLKSKKHLSTENIAQEFDKLHLSAQGEIQRRRRANGRQSRRHGHGTEMNAPSEQQKFLDDRNALEGESNHISNTITTKNDDAILIEPQPITVRRRSRDALINYQTRCQQDSERLLNLCPKHLRGVYQSFIRQAEACNLADQCNAGQPLIPDRDILLAKVGKLGNPSRATVKTSEDTIESDTESKDDVNSNDTQLQEKALKNHNDKSKRVRVHLEAEKNALRAWHDRFTAALEELNKPTEDTDGERDDKETKKDADACDNGVNDQNIPDLHGKESRTKLPAVGKIDDAPSTSEAPRPSRLEGDGSRPQNTGEEQPYHETRDEVIRVFCVERPNQKKPGAFYRNFVATSLSMVWRKYLESSPLELHWYEVIRDNRACHLYFDLEYALGDGLNEDVQGERLVDQLLHHVAELFQRNWNLQLDLQRHVYELDSSSPTKFSRHIIFNIPGYAFANNAAAGQFVAQVLATAGSDLDVAKGLSPETQLVSFVDSAVYSRNRHFRMVYSCKGGKSAVLRPTDRFATAPCDDRPSPAQIFLKTFICNVSPDVKLLAMHEISPYDSQRPIWSYASASWSEHMSNFHGNITCGSAGQRQVSWKTDDGEARAGSNKKGAKEDDASKKLNDLKTLAERAVPFVESVARTFSKQEARARTIRFCGRDGTVAYSMIGKTVVYDVLISVL